MGGKAKREGPRFELRQHIRLRMGAEAVELFWTWLGTDVITSMSSAA